jgi:hypothetical protein
VLTQGGQETNPVTATIKVGQVLRVQLSAGIRWNLNQSDKGADLAAITPFGYFHEPDGTCIWNFTAATAGKVNLNFTGGLVCAPNTACPAIAAIAAFTVTVQ